MCMMQKKSEKSGVSNNMSYQEEMKHNERVFWDVLQRTRPDVFVLVDIMDKHNVDPLIVFKFLRQLINIGEGSGWGEVVIVINNKKVKIMRGTDTERVNVPIFTDKVRFDKV